MYKQFKVYMTLSACLVCALHAGCEEPPAHARAVLPAPETTSLQQLRDCGPRTVCKWIIIVDRDPRYTELYNKECRCGAGYECRIDGDDSVPGSHTLSSMKFDAFEHHCRPLPPTLP